MCCNLFYLSAYNTKVDNFIGGSYMYFNDNSSIDTRHKHHDKERPGMLYYMYPMNYSPCSYCSMKEKCPYIHHRQDEASSFRQPDDDRISYDYSPYNYPGFYPPYFYPYEYSEDDYSYDHHHNHSFDHGHYYDHDHSYDHHREDYTHGDHSSGHDGKHD